MKKLFNTGEKDLKKVIEEASLLSYLDCDEIVKCTDLYFYKQIVYIFLEYMEQGAMTDIILGYR